MAAPILRLRLTLRINVTIRQLWFWFQVCSVYWIWWLYKRCPVWYREMGSEQKYQSFRSSSSMSR